MKMVLFSHSHAGLSEWTHDQLANASVFELAGVFSVHYTSALTPRLIVGFEDIESYVAARERTDWEHERTMALGLSVDLMDGKIPVRGHFFYRYTVHP